MLISIMHLSDLHRDPTQGVRNGPLLRSLLNDRDRYVSGAPGIQPPTLIVVSGDIVYGVPSSHSAPVDALVAQYKEAEDFLCGLADSFLSGDRERLILVPGNHDISFPDTLAALEPLTISSHSPLKESVADLFSPHARHRWSWSDLQLYRVNDSDRYNRRIALFADLYSRFYNGTRAYSLSPAEQFDIFSFPSLGVVIAAFNSCYNNDPLHRPGCIHPDAIASAARRIETLRYQGSIPIAVWHHNIAGGPHSDDYMDADTLQVMIDCGFSIGLHGHQHKSTYLDERFRFDTGRKITVISAGTLCGGFHSLPHGQDRSYNLLELDSVEFTATVHQRRMVNETSESPVWSCGWYAESNASRIRFSIQQPLVPQITPQARLSQAEALLAVSDYEGARDLLRPLASTNDIARRMLLECYTTLPYDESLISILYPPQSISEALVLADAMWELGDRSRLGAMLCLGIVTDSHDSTILEMRTKYEARLK